MVTWRILAVYKCDHCMFILSDFSTVVAVATDPQFSIGPGTMLHQNGDSTSLRFPFAYLANKRRKLVLSRFYANYQCSLRTLPICWA